MRQLAAAVLKVPLAGFGYLSRYVSRRSVFTQLAIAGLAVALVVSGLLVGLPTKTIEAKAPTPYQPAAPTVALGTSTKVSVDEPYVLAFTEPMNQGSVADALTIKPADPVRLDWDAAGETLSIAPATYWAPFTTYTVSVSGSAMDQSGMQLGSPVTAGFTTGALTSGQITATVVSGGMVAPTSAFQITFSRPVKLATVQARLSISPVVTGTITGDDPTDVSSQVFTFTPDDILAGGTAYTVSFDSSNATDSAGVALLPVTPLKVQTLAAPQVVRFNPQNGKTTTDPNQVISVRFTVPMTRASTAAALSVTVNGKRVRGAISWAENNTVLILDPNGTFPVGSTVYMHIATTARSATGQRLAGAASSSFKIVRPTVRRITWHYPAALATAPWHGAELYMLALMNCTRTGGWVTSSGSCSSVTHHVLPAQAALAFDDGIANKVSRPYAKYLADRNALSHTLLGSPHSRLAAAGYGSGTWGEHLFARQSPSGGHDPHRDLLPERVSLSAQPMRVRPLQERHEWELPQGRHRRLGDQGPHPSGDRLLRLRVAGRTGDSWGPTISAPDPGQSDRPDWEAKWPPPHRPGNQPICRLFGHGCNLRTRGCQPDAPARRPCHGD